MEQNKILTEAADKLDLLFSDNYNQDLCILTESTINNIQTINDKNLENAGNLIGSALSAKSEELLESFIKSIKEGYKQALDNKCDYKEINEELKKNVNLDFL